MKCKHAIETTNAAYKKKYDVASREAILEAPTSRDVDSQPQNFYPKGGGIPGPPFVRGCRRLTVQVASITVTHHSVSCELLQGVKVCRWGWLS